MTAASAPAPDHTLDLRKVAAGEDVPERVASGPIGRELVFTVRYTTPEGDRLEATVTSRIMTGEEQDKAARWAAVAAGAPWEHLPPAQQARIWAQIHCAVQLRDEPEWLIEWIGKDDELLFKLAEVVDGHARRYFRRDGGAGADGPGRSRVVLAFADPAADPRTPD